MDIKITLMGGSTYLLKEVNPNATVGDLKKLIQQKSGVASALQKLSSENGVDFSNDSCTLSAIGLKSGSCIVVLVLDQDPVVGLPFQVLLKNDKGQISTYNVMSGETVKVFKEKVYNKERVPVDQQRLIYNGKQLEDGKKLEDYGIKTLDTIFLVLRLRGGALDIKQVD